MRSYLVQRGTFKHRDREQVVGIDSLIRLHYMGSAEFEFGALPKSLNRIIDGWKHYGNFETTLKNQEGTTIYVLCRKEKSSECIQCVVEVSEQKHRLKESAQLKDYLEGKERPDSVYFTNFWWDVANDWMACAGIEDMEILKYGIQKVIEKRKSKG